MYSDITPGTILYIQEYCVMSGPVRYIENVTIGTIERLQ